MAITHLLIQPSRQIQGQPAHDPNSAIFHQSNQGEDESFWWNRLDTLTTVAAEAPRINIHSQELPGLLCMRPDLSILATARGRVFPQLQTLREPETLAEDLNERTNSRYLDMIKTDPRRKFT